MLFSDATVPRAFAYSVRIQLQYHDTAVTSTEHHRLEIEQQSARPHLTTFLRGPTPVLLTQLHSMPCYAHSVSRYFSLHTA